MVPTPSSASSAFLRPSASQAEALLAGLEDRGQIAQLPQVPPAFSVAECLELLIDAAAIDGHWDILQEKTV